MAIDAVCDSVSQIFLARFVLARGDSIVEGGGVLVEGGRVVKVLGDGRSVAEVCGRASVEVIDLGDGVLTPGLVNAHAHLELGWARGLLDEGLGFAKWVGQLVQARRGIEASQEIAAWKQGARTLLEGGTTTVADIDASDAPAGDAFGTAWVGPRVLRLREVLDAGDEKRGREALERVTVPLRDGAQQWEGLSPHAPFTVSPGLLSDCSRLARKRSLPLQIHWAESLDEREWLLHGEGPFASILSDAPRTSGLDLLDQADLLGPATSLVHANHPEAGDVRRVAESGASVVHCPGTHAFFDRAPFAWEPWIEAGVPVALGTDSLASNRELNMCREMALARLAAPNLGPLPFWDGATRIAARALGLGGIVGILAPGSWADLALFDVDEGYGSLAPDRRRVRVLEALTTGQARLRRVFLGGKSVSQNPGSGTDS